MLSYNLQMTDSQFTPGVPRLFADYYVSSMHTFALDCALTLNTTWICFHWELDA